MTVELTVPDGAHILTCPDCGSELLGRPGQAIAHDFTDGSHVWYPAKATDDLEQDETPEPKNDVPEDQSTGTPTTEYPDEDDANVVHQPVTEGD